MTESVFYTLAYDLLKKECDRLIEFTAVLDKNPAEKKTRIAEYKCAKYRYATVSLIHSTLYNNYMRSKEFDLSNYRHLLMPFCEMLESRDEYVAIYDVASEEEKPDTSLYYANRVFAEQEIVKLTSKLLLATDWEKIELEERIGGLKFAIECLDKAWKKRKDVSE